MSEPTQGPDQEGRTLDAEQLRRQAEELRQEGYKPSAPLPQGPSGISQVIYAVLLVLIVGSVLVLLFFGNTRVKLIRTIANAWGSLYPLEERAEIYKLPPPPPKAVEPRVILQGSPTFAYEPRPSAGVATGEGEAPEGEEPEPGAESKPPAPPEKTAGANAAFGFLVKKSDVARRLSNNDFPGFRFKEWRPVRNAAPEFWVDLVATKSNGQEAHFIWLVNSETDNVRPLSQDARDIERK